MWEGWSLPAMWGHRQKAASLQARNQGWTGWTARTDQHLDFRFLSLQNHEKEVCVAEAAQAKTETYSSWGVPTPEEMAEARERWTVGSSISIFPECFAGLCPFVHFSFFLTCGVCCYLWLPGCMSEKESEMKWLFCRQMENKIRGVHREWGGPWTGREGSQPRPGPGTTRALLCPHQVTHSGASGPTWFCHLFSSRLIG